MKNNWIGYSLFIFLFVAFLAILAAVFPYSNRIDHPLNRILPLGGFLLGHEPEAWLGDLPGERMIGGRGKRDRTFAVDVDFIQTGGRWYKIKGPVYITKGGRIIGWHREVTFDEVLYIRRWLFLIR